MYQLDWVEDCQHFRVIWKMCNCSNHICNCFWDAYIATLRQCDIDLVSFGYYGAWEEIGPCDILIIEAIINE